MTASAGIGVVFVELLVFKVPATTVDVVHAMGAIKGKGQAGVAAAAFAQRPGMTLKLNGSQVIVGGSEWIWPDRMGRAVTTFAGNAAMSEAVSIERSAVFRKSLVTGQAGCGGIDIIFPGLGQAQGITQVAVRIAGVAGFAAGFIQPGPPFIATHRKHAAMAVLATDACGTHCTPETLGHFTRMALIAGLLQAAIHREQCLFGIRIY